MNPRARGLTGGWWGGVLSVPLGVVGGVRAADHGVGVQGQLVRHEEDVPVLVEVPGRPGWPWCGGEGGRGAVPVTPDETCPAVAAG